MLPSSTRSRDQWAKYEAAIRSESKTLWTDPLSRAVYEAAKGTQQAVGDGKQRQAFVDVLLTTEEV